MPAASKLADDIRIDLSLNDLSSQIKTDFGGYELISKLIILGCLENLQLITWQKIDGF